MPISNMIIFHQMANNFKHSGKCVTVVLGSGETAVASGKGYKIGSQVGIVLGLTRLGQTVFVGTASAEDDQAVVALEGVFTHAKATEAVTNGQRLYWNDTTKVVTTVNAGNTFMGFADGAAESGDATVDVRLVQGDASGAAIADVVAAVTAANGSDAGTTQTLANALKVTVNEILVELKAAGLMASA